jgi:hypothetical protein
LEKFMRLIMCISKNGGIAFHHRRQSRDEQVCKDMISLSEGRLCVSAYSADLFSGIADVIVCDDCRSAGDEYYFAEREMPGVDIMNLSEVVLYHWNREYPADVFFDLDLSGFTRKEVVEFAGKSHACIRREIWERDV